jgi:hypothetical protein
MPHGRACPSPPLTGASRLLAPHRRRSTVRDSMCGRDDGDHESGIGGDDQEAAAPGDPVAGQGRGRRWHGQRALPEDNRQRAAEVSIAACASGLGRERRFGRVPGPLQRCCLPGDVALRTEQDAALGMLGTQGLHPPHASAKHPRPAAGEWPLTASRRVCPPGSQLTTEGDGGFGGAFTPRRRFGVGPCRRRSYPEEVRVAAVQRLTLRLTGDAWGMIVNRRAGPPWPAHAGECQPGRCRERRNIGARYRGCSKTAPSRRTSWALRRCAQIA